MCGEVWHGVGGWRAGAMYCSRAKRLGDALEAERGETAANGMEHISCGGQQRG